MCESLRRPAGINVDAIADHAAMILQVHKVLLKRDSSMFSDMFSIPQAPELHESGGSRDNPLVLVGETPDAFRALCWILYALYV